jgi:hypothetical protein
VLPLLLLLAGRTTQRTWGRDGVDLPVQKAQQQQLLLASPEPQPRHPPAPCLLPPRLAPAPQLIGTAHGQLLENLIKNPTLSDLVGGICSVTLGDEEARQRGTQKSVLERKAPPTFPLVIEMRERAYWVTHWVEDSVDCLLTGKVPIVQVGGWAGGGGGGAAGGSGGGGGGGGGGPPRGGADACGGLCGRGRLRGRVACVGRQAGRQPCKCRVLVCLCGDCWLSFSLVCLPLPVCPCLSAPACLPLPA